MLDQYFFLYVSDMAPSTSPETVSAIARQSRSHNFRNGLTGFLVFDGKSFAQYIEGPADSTAALLDRLKADTRHERIEVLHSGRRRGAQRFPGWRLGYLRLNLQEFGIASLRGKTGPAAMEAFEFVLPALDIITNGEGPRGLASPTTPRS